MTESTAPRLREPHVATLRRTLPGLLRDPLGTLVALADATPGQVVRLNLGSIRPYLVTEPAHVQHVLRDNAANYARAGDSMMWKSVRKLAGDGILSEGPEWEASRRRLQPHFTAKRIDGAVDDLSRAIGEAIDELAGAARDGEPVDAASELSRIICQAVIRVFFGDKIAVADGVRVVAEQDTVATALRFRLLAPFLPDAVPMPGDRAFRRAVQNIDEILLPLVRAERARPDDGGDDIIWPRWPAPATRDGRKLDEQQVRNDTGLHVRHHHRDHVRRAHLALPAAGAVARHRRAALRGDRPGGRPRRRDQPRTARRAALHPDGAGRAAPRSTRSGWFVPRRAVADDVIGDTRIRAGGTIVVSPYVTQRMARFWDRPEVFDPERFAPERLGVPTGTPTTRSVAALTNASASTCSSWRRR